MKTEKQKVIEKAYGSNFLTVFPWVDENGKFNLRSRKLIEIDNLMKDFTKNDLIQEVVNGQLEVYIRPKTLEGIEDNNGWIKIDNEEQYNELFNDFYEWYNIKKKESWIGDLEYYSKATHYRIIQPNKPPIY